MIFDSILQTWAMFYISYACFFELINKHVNYGTNYNSCLRMEVISHLLLQRHDGASECNLKTKMLRGGRILLS